MSQSKDQERMFTKERLSLLRLAVLTMLSLGCGGAVLGG